MWTDNGNGTYTATVTNTVAESNNLRNPGRSKHHRYSHDQIYSWRMIQPIQTQPWLQHQQVLWLMALLPQP